jgi:hypothetical protein
MEGAACGNNSIIIRFYFRFFNRRVLPTSMAAMIVKDKHKSGFLQMNNEAVQDPSLSWAAKGLLAYLLSLPEEWEPHLRDLFSRSADGRKPTEAAMNELIAAGYVKKEQGKNYRRNTRYTVYETPAR